MYDNRFEKVFLQAIALLQKQKRMQLVWVEKKMSKEFNSINISYLNSLTLVKLRSFFFIKI